MRTRRPVMLSEAPRPPGCVRPSPYCRLTTMASRWARIFLREEAAHEQRLVADRRLGRTHGCRPHRRSGGDRELRARPAAVRPLRAGAQCARRHRGRPQREPAVDVCRRRAAGQKDRHTSRAQAPPGRARGYRGRVQLGRECTGKRLTPSGTTSHRPGQNTRSVASASLRP